MKTIIKSIKNVVLPILTIVAISATFTGCKKAQQPTPTVPTTTNVEPQDESIKTVNLIGLRVDSGFCYRIGYDLTDIGDSNTAPTVSKLRLFENGVELGPAHSNHNDIRSFGLGQFSHWGNTLYFSTSDNTDPLKNGRKYTYTVK